MAIRYAGSRRPGLVFDDFNPSGAGTGGAAAAGMGTVGEVNSQLRNAAPDWGGLGANSVRTDSAMRVAASDAEASVHSAGIPARSQVDAAKLEADAAKSAARSQAQGSMIGGIVKTGASLLGAAFLSDETTKNTIEYLDDALSTLRQLKPVSFYYNEEYSSSPERLHHGFIAQDYNKVLPDATYFDESTGKLCIDTGDLIGILVRAVQQLETKVTRLEAANALVGVK